MGRSISNIDMLDGNINFGLYKCSAESVTVEPGTAATLEVNFLVTTAGPNLFQSWWETNKYLLSNKQRDNLETKKDFERLAGNFLIDCYLELFPQNAYLRQTHWRTSNGVQFAFMNSLKYLPQVEMQVKGTISAVARTGRPVTAMMAVELVSIDYGQGVFIQALNLAGAKALNTSGSVNEEIDTYPELTMMAYRR